MNVLLIGDDNRLVEALIIKLNKSNHRIYWLTGQKKKKTSRAHVFETYHFSYTDSNVKDIIESVRPDAILFTGAYDTGFDWKYNGQAEALRYTTAVVNILSAYSMFSTGKFIYLSSQEVFDGSYTDDISEETTVVARGFKAPAVSQGEALCKNYREIQGVNTVILRLDHIYSIPEKGQSDGDPCFDLCLKALRTGKITADSGKKFSMLYLNDAVELIYQVIEKQDTDYSCYHISSMEAITEIQLAEIVKRKMGGNITLVDLSTGENERKILDGRRYKTEFGQKIFHDYEEGVGKIVQFMKMHSETFLKDNDAGGDWKGKVWHNVKVTFKILLPFIENLAGFALFFFLNGQTAGSQYFSKLDFYLLYVLLFAIVHGQQQAIFSALLAMLGYCFQQSYIRSGYEVLLDYNTYVWMAQLFIVGMAVGYMRDHLRHVREDNENEVKHLYEK